MANNVAKAHSTCGEVKKKILQNLNVIDPGKLQSPRREASVPCTGKLFTETVPGATVLTVLACSELKRLKVNFANDMDCSNEVEVVLSDKLLEGSG